MLLAGPRMVVWLRRSISTPRHSCGLPRTMADAMYSSPLLLPPPLRRLSLPLWW
jgi:hypothetical protein